MKLVLQMSQENIMIIVPICLDTRDIESVRNLSSSVPVKNVYGDKFDYP